MVSPVPNLFFKDWDHGTGTWVRGPRDPGTGTKGQGPLTRTRRTADQDQGAWQGPGTRKLAGTRDLDRPGWTRDPDQASSGAQGDQDQPRDQGLGSKLLYFI